jgi:hypothetical protein
MSIKKLANISKNISKSNKCLKLGKSFFNKSVKKGKKIPQLKVGGYY